MARRGSFALLKLILGGLRTWAGHQALLVHEVRKLREAYEVRNPLPHAAVQYSQGDDDYLDQQLMQDPTLSSRAEQLARDFQHERGRLPDADEIWAALRAEQERSQPNVTRPYCQPPTNVS